MEALLTHGEGLMVPERMIVAPSVVTLPYVPWWTAVTRSGRAVAAEGKARPEVAWRRSRRHGDVRCEREASASASVPVVAEVAASGAGSPGPHRERGAMEGILPTDKAQDHAGFHRAAP